MTIALPQALFGTSNVDFHCQGRMTSTMMALINARDVAAGDKGRHRRHQQVSRYAVDAGGAAHLCHVASPGCSSAGGSRLPPDRQCRYSLMIIAAEVATLRASVQCDRTRANSRLFVASLPALPEPARVAPRNTERRTRRHHVHCSIFRPDKFTTDPALRQTSKY